MSAPDGYTRIGLALSPRQIACLREMSARTGITQTAFLTACIETLEDEEVMEIIKRHAQVKIAAYAEKMLGKPYVAP